MEGKVSVFTTNRVSLTSHCEGLYCNGPWDMHSCLCLHSLFVSEHIVQALGKPSMEAYDSD